jgi:hypothetical protein
MARFFFVEMRRNDKPQWPAFLVDDEYPANDSAVHPVTSYTDALHQGDERGAGDHVNFSRSAMKDMIAQGVGPPPAAPAPATEVSAPVKPSVARTTIDTEVAGDPDFLGQRPGSLAVSTSNHRLPPASTRGTA